MDTQITLLANFLNDIHQFDDLSDENVHKFFEEVKPLLLGTRFMNTTTQFDQAMRVLASQEGALRYLRILDQVDPNLKNAVDFTDKSIPLFQAFDVLENARFFLDANPASVDHWYVTFKGTCTVMSAAITSKHPLEAFRLLVEKKCTSHTRNLHTRHPLIVAMEASRPCVELALLILRCRPSLIVELLQYAVNPTHKPSYNIYSWVVENGSLANILELEELCPLSEKDAWLYNITAYRKAVLLEKIDIAEHFAPKVDKGKYQEYTKFKQIPILFAACKSNNRRLLDVVWSVAAERPYLQACVKGETAFDISAKRHCIESCLFLLDKGYDWSELAWNRNRSIMQLVVRIPNGQPVIRRLAEKSRKFIDFTERDVSPYVNAALLGRFENADCLAELGANTSLANDHESPITVALRHDNAEALSYFLNNGVKPLASETNSRLVFLALERNSTGCLTILHNEHLDDACEIQGERFLTAFTQYRETNYSDTLALRMAFHNGYTIHYIENLNSFLSRIHRYTNNSVSKLLYAYFGLTYGLSEQGILEERYDVYFHMPLVERLLGELARKPQVSCQHRILLN